MRIFISIDLPEKIKSKIFHSFEKIEQLKIVKGKFVEKNNLHLTLKFLGNISEEKISEIEKILSTIKFDSFNVRLGNIGFFPNKNYIKIVWIELISDEIYNLQKIIDEKLKFMFNEKIIFYPHITVLRIKSIKNKTIFLDKIKEINFKNISFDINFFSLTKSELKKEGPSYKLLNKFSLGT